MPVRRTPARRPRGSTAPLLHAKLVRPSLGPGVLDRGLLERGLVDHAGCALTLVVADAGYGKTTLLAAAAAAQRRPVVWYSLMPSDADPMVFGRHLLAGFRREWPRFGRDLARVLDEPRPGGPSPEIIAGTLANELGALNGPATLLVLDDFHEVDACAPVVAIVDTLLRFLPATVRVAIASRTPPPLSLDRLRAQGQLFELDSSQLRFSRAELARLFGDETSSPSDADLDGLERATHGWPTAARLVLEASRRRAGVPLARVLDELGDSPLEVRSYVSSEVVRRLDPDDRRLLERTAALMRLDAALAQALSGLRDARARLEALARRGLLRAFGDGEPRSYEFHDLVRDVVRSDLRERDGEAAWRALERDTGVALRERGDTEPALMHLLSAGADRDATALLRDLAPGLLRDGRAATLLRYLDSLPAAVIDADAALLVARADASQALGQWDEAHGLYDRAIERSRADGRRDLECRALLGLGKVLNLRGRHELVLGMAERGLAMAGGLGLETRARLMQLKASAHFYLGQSPAAVALLGQVRSLLEGHADSELMVPCIHNLAVALATQGRFLEAAREFRAALALVRGTASPRSPLYLSNLAVLLTELGELTEARRAAEEGLQAAQRFANRGQEVACWVALADAMVRGADLDGALSALKRAEDLNAALGMELIAADLLALRGRVFCARGQYRRAAELLHRALERLGDRPDTPRLPEFRALLAWCELRSGRAHAARALLEQLAPAADRGENEHQRMRIHYWLGEALLALGEAKAAEPHLAEALRRVRERGYDHFLQLQAREEPAPLLHALARGIEVDRCAGALAAAGPVVEEPLLELVDAAPTAVAEAALAVLGEIGGQASLERLPGLVRSRRALQAAARTVLRHVGERAQRGRPPAAGADAPSPRLVLFGPPRLVVAGEPLAASAWRTQRAFHILAFLALRPRGASRDELLEAFWPGRQLAAGRRNFHPTLSYIRTVLPRGAAAPLLREGESYRVNPAYPLTCDAWEFESAREAARRAADPAAARQALERAAALADRPLLEGWYGDWADELQGRMRDAVETLMLELGQHAESARDHERALACFRRAAELDAFRESTRVAVVRCLVALGNQRAAVVEYDKLKTLLRAELGTDPLPETEEAFQRAMSRSAPPGPDASEMSQRLAAQSAAAPAQAPIKPGNR